MGDGRSEHAVAGGGAAARARGSDGGRAAVAADRRHGTAGVSNGESAYARWERARGRAETWKHETTGSGVPRTLARIAALTAVIVNCAGPFVLHGPPVIEACIVAGTHYVDLTGAIAVRRSTRVLFVLSSHPCRLLTLPRRAQLLRHRRPVVPRSGREARVRARRPSCVAQPSAVPLTCVLSCVLSGWAGCASCRPAAWTRCRRTLLR